MSKINRFTTKGGNKMIYDNINNTNTVSTENEIYLSIIRNKWNGLKNKISNEYQRLNFKDTTYCLYLANLINKIKIEEKTNDYIYKNFFPDEKHLPLNEINRLFNLLKKHENEFFVTKNTELNCNEEQKEIYYHSMMDENIKMLEKALPLYKTYLNRLEEELKHSNKFINLNNIVEKKFKVPRNNALKSIYKINKEIPNTIKLLNNELDLLPDYIWNLKFSNEHKDTYNVWKNFGPTLNEESAQLILLSAEMDHLNNISKTIDTYMRPIELNAKTIINNRNNIVIEKKTEPYEPSKLSINTVYKDEVNPTIATITREEMASLTADFNGQHHTRM